MYPPGSFSLPAACGLAQASVAGHGWQILGPLFDTFSSWCQELHESIAAQRLLASSILSEEPVAHVFGAVNVLLSRFKTLCAAHLRLRGEPMLRLALVQLRETVGRREQHALFLE